MHTAWIVPWIVPAHVVAGGLALVFGYVALYAAKGAPLHRKSAAPLGALRVGAPEATALSASSR